MSRTYTVKKGQGLMQVAREVYGADNADKYMVIYEANKKTIGSNPDKVKAGQVLTIPELGSPSRTYTVKQGQGLMQVAREVYGADNANKYMIIYEANKKAIGSNPDKVKAGQVLTIPELPD